jgi:histone H3/H4
MTHLPIAPIRRIVKNAGAERVSQDATLALADLLTEYGIEISEKAVSLARHAGRKTVKKEDIVKAVKEVSKMAKEVPKMAKEVQRVPGTAPFFPPGPGGKTLPSVGPPRHYSPPGPGGVGPGPMGPPGH